MGSGEAAWGADGAGNKRRSYREKKLQLTCVLKLTLVSPMRGPPVAIELAGLLLRDCVFVWPRGAYC